MTQSAKLALAILAVAALAGCASGIFFPASPLSRGDTPRGLQAAYDTDSDGKTDYFTYADAAGRVTVIAYDYSNDGQPDSFVNLDAQPTDRCRHFFIILDGVSYDLVKEYYDAGHFRMFHPPSRVVAPFPSMTDLGVQDLLGDMPSLSMEANYYDRRRGAGTNGAWDYLMEKNAPARRLFAYRVPSLFDVLSYFTPWQVFKHEIGEAKKALDRRDRQDVLAYSVGSAGMGTGNSREGHVRCLELVERMVNQITWESRGTVKFTIVSDHGHTYTKPKRFTPAGVLEKKGWRSRPRVKSGGDYVQIEFGDVTCAAFYAQDAARLAADLATVDGADLAVYSRDEKVFVVSRRGNAVITENKGRFKYEPDGGDPLLLNEIIAELKAAGKADENGFIDDRALLEATAGHVYPDPLRRLWRAFHGLVENVPDVIVSLEDDYYAGSGNFAFLVKLNSTHGSLNSRNSLAFAMTTVGPLPPTMRSEDISKNLSALLDRPFPPGK